MDEQALNKKLAEEELSRKLLDWADLLELRKVTLTGREGEEYQQDAFFFKPTGDRLVTQCWQDRAGKWRWQDGWYLGLGWLVQSLDACFKWLVPKLQNKEIGLTRMPNANWIFYIWGMAEGDMTDIAIEAETPSLALCRAIEELIDGGIKWKKWKN